jgi:soluble cytochrome b562
MAEQEPGIEDLKAQEKEDVAHPVERLVIEEDDLDADETRSGHDVTAELQKLGHQLGETLQSAWESEERKRMEKEVREGMQSFVAEIDKVLQGVKESDATGKLKEDAVGAKTKVEESELGQKARIGIVEGLHWLSQGLNELAIKFAPPEKSADVPDGALDEEE